MLVPRDVDFKSDKRKRSEIAVVTRNNAFRRFNVDFSVITPNSIVRFKYVDEKNKVFHMLISTSFR